MKIFKIEDVCDKLGFADLRDTLINHYKVFNENFLKLEMPQWMQLNEFGDPDLIKWWDAMYRTYNLIPCETFYIKYER